MPLEASTSAPLTCEEHKAQLKARIRELQATGLSSWQAVTARLNREGWRSLTDEGKPLSKGTVYNLALEG